MLPKKCALLFCWNYHLHTLNLKLWNGVQWTLVENNRCLSFQTWKNVLLWFCAWQSRCSACEAPFTSEFMHGNQLEAFNKSKKWIFIAIGNNRYLVWWTLSIRYYMFWSLLRNNFLTFIDDLPPKKTPLVIWIFDATSVVKIIYLRSMIMYFSAKINKPSTSVRSIDKDIIWFGCFNVQKWWINKWKHYFCSNSSRWGKKYYIFINENSLERASTG